VPQEGRHLNDTDIQWDGTGGVPWVHLPSILPSGLPSVDEEPLLKTIFQTSVRRAELVDVSTAEGLYLVNRRFYVWLQAQIELDSQRVGNTLLNQFKAQVEKSVSISSVSMSSTVQVTQRHEDLEEDIGRGKKGKKGPKTAAVAAESDSHPPVPKGGKKSEPKKKAQKANQTSNASEPSASVSSTSLSPFVEDERLVGLIKEWCQPIVDFLEGRIRSDSRDSIDEASEDSAVWTPLYVGLWESLKERSLDLYSRVAAKAKEEAAQVHCAPLTLLTYLGRCHRSDEEGTREGQEIRIHVE
jgi:hypothetical protein